MFKQWTNGAFLVEFLLVAFIVICAMISLLFLAIVSATHPGADATSIQSTLQGIATAGFGALVALAYAAKGKTKGDE